MIRLGVLVGFLALLAGCNSPAPSGGGGEFRLAGVVGGNETQPILNGLPLRLEGARITLDGQPADQTAVQPGVELWGIARQEGDGLRLLEAEAVYKAKGRLDEVNPAEAYVVLAGLRVNVDASTLIVEEDPDGGYTNLTLAELRAGDYVKVAGTFQQGDTLLATRIERKTTPSDEVSLRVHVRNLDPANNTFTYGLGTYAVDYSGAQVKGSLAEGVEVKVKGTQGTNSIQARKVEVLNPSGQTATEIKLEGPLTNLDTASQSFTLLGYTVNYGNAQLRGTLAEGAWVEVKGTLGEDGFVQATEVKVKQSHRGSGRYTGEVKGPVSGVGQNTIQLSNLTFWTDESTLVTREDHQQISLGEIRVGDWVKVKYDENQRDASGNPYAVKIEVKPSSSSKQKLKGPIADFDPTNKTFSVNGVMVTVTQSTRYKVKVNGQYNNVGEEVFWGEDRTGWRAEAKGVMNGNSLEASKVEVKR